jgi:MFS family permease
VIALVSTIGAAVANSFNGYMAGSRPDFTLFVFPDNHVARFLQGFGVSPAATVGMAIINDLFFEHERGQKLGLWVLALDMGLLFGPLSMYFLALGIRYALTGDSRWIRDIKGPILGPMAHCLDVCHITRPRVISSSRDIISTQTYAVSHAKLFGQVGQGASRELRRYSSDDESSILQLEAGPRYRCSKTI